MKTGEINQVRSAIVATIAQNLPALKSCAPHGGRFDLQELQRWSMQAPAVAVSAVQIPGVANDETNQVRVRWVAYLIVKDAPGVTRDVVALDYTEALLRLARGNTWGLDNLQRPESLAADNLYNGQSDRKGMALWAVSWQQSVNLRHADISQLADFELYTGTHQVGGDNDPELHSRAELNQEE